MLPRQYRLKRSALFPKTLSAGKPLYRCPYFTLLALPRAYPSGSPIRVGFIVSRKTANRANKRNRIKRRLREIVRKSVLPYYKDKIDPYITLVFITRSPILEASYSMLEASVTACFKTR